MCKYACVHVLYMYTYVDGLGLGKISEGLAIDTGIVSSVVYISRKRERERERERDREREDLFKDACAQQGSWVGVVGVGGFK